MYVNEIYSTKIHNIMTNNLQKANSELNTELHGSIGILQIMINFKTYEVKEDKDTPKEKREKLEKGSLHWKPRIYPSIVKTFLIWASKYDLLLSENTLNSYIVFLKEQKKIKNVSTYKTPIKKLLGIAKANKFLGFRIVNDTDKENKFDEGLGILFEKFLSKGTGKVKQKRTKQGYRNSFKEFNNFLAKKGISKEDKIVFSYDAVMEYKNHLNGLIGVGAIVEFTANTYLAPLRQFAKYCIRESYDIFKDTSEQERIRIERDLDKVVIIPNFTNTKNEAYYKDSLTHEEVLKVINKADNSKEKLIVALMYFTGLRTFEVLKIKFSSFDFKGKELTVIGKGNKTAHVPLEHCFEALKSYFDAYIKDYKPNAEKDQDKPLFENWNSTANIRKFVNRILTDLDLKKKKKNVSAHSFRHSLIQNLLKNDVPIISVQKIARHENISTTEKYFKKLQAENTLKIPENVLTN